MVISIFHGKYKSGVSSLPEYGKGKKRKQTNKKTHPKSDIRREGEHIIHFESYFFLMGSECFQLLLYEEKKRSL